MKPRNFIAKDLRTGTKYSMRIAPLKKGFNRSKEKAQFRKVIYGSV